MLAVVPWGGQRRTAETLWDKASQGGLPGGEALGAMWF